MTVRKYQPEDFAQIKEWGSEWGSVYDEGQFPVHGFIVDGIAAYFLYQTDSTVCWLENMISKRGIPDQIRSKALDMLTDAILKEACELGFTVAYATTDVISVAKRAKENGAMVRPGQILLIKDLTYRTQ